MSQEDNLNVVNGTVVLVLLVGWNMNGQYLQNSFEHLIQFKPGPNIFMDTLRQSYILMVHSLMFNSN